MAALPAGCVSTEPVGGGGDKGPVTGSAGGAATENKNSSLEHCDTTLGTLGVVEDQNASWFQELRNYKLGSTVPVIRMMIQQSNCCFVVERGNAMQNMNTERALQQSGEMRGGSNLGKGQMVAADYTMNPSIQFSQNTGGMGGALGGFSGALGVAGAIAGGYSNSPEGKLIIAAFADSYNQLVRVVRSYKAQTVKGGLQGVGRIVNGQAGRQSRYQASPQTRGNNALMRATGP